MKSDVACTTERGMHKKSVINGIYELFNRLFFRVCEMIGMRRKREMMNKKTIVIMMKVGK